MATSKVLGSKKPRKPHLVKGPGGQAAEIDKLRADTDAAFLAMEKSGLIVKYFIQVATEVVDADGIKLQFASAAAPVVLTGTDFDGILAPGTGPALIKSPKRVTFTVGGGGTPAEWTGSDIIFTGTDADGKVLTETVASAAGAGATTTVGYFASITQVSIVSAQGGTGAQLTIGVAADTASIASFSSSTDAQVLDTGAEFNRARIGNRKMLVARRISFVFSNNAHWDVSTITVEGFDIRGVRITDTIAVPDSGNATVTTAKFFAQVTKIIVPIQSGSAGTCSVGPLNTELGLDIDILSTVVAVSVLRDANDPGTGVWAVPSAGTVGTAATANSAPYGKFVPNVPPDGIRSYVLAYLPNYV